MFTGIVEKMGKILSITAMDTTGSGGSGYSVVVECADILSDVILGDSIAVNGIIKRFIIDP
jgi:riboflavin synthase